MYTKRDNTSEISQEDIDFFVFHQANKFILEQLIKKLQIPSKKVPISLKYIGNTVSSSIPIALSLLIDQKKIIKTMKYSHPVFKYNKEFVLKKIEEIQGIDNIYYCGAWCGYGFHEDGVVSAKNAVKNLI